MQFKEIPKKLVVSKRLSQCLNPALPTGVHQRALDVYSHIFAVLGVRASSLQVGVVCVDTFSVGRSSERPGFVVVWPVSLL